MMKNPALFPKTRNTARMSTPTTSVQHCARGSSQCDKAEVDNNENKGDAA